ncbi:hypothetical protein JRQ81_017605 [Phrynocephalus forsythii]|uniref:PID domain-containing protein n=1 Tax=Phrynocephalus forsythii TaxID=171643 RepID=A0A9Q0XQM4_9SAUR|nr:hypothetical protein JRQ81_017605 [Phrynocephalus forsythii]
MRGRRTGQRRAPPAEEPQHQQQQQRRRRRQRRRQQQQQQHPQQQRPGEAMLPWKRHKFEVLAADEEEKRRREQPQTTPPPPPAASRASGAPPPGKSRGCGGPASGGAGGLPCSAALGSLARACPAQGALSRMGNLFRSKRKTFRVSSEAPTYTVLYLGNATTLQAKGEGCTDVAVGKIWAKSEAGRQGTKMKLTIGPQGIRMAPAEATSGRPGHLYLLHRVTYCVADPRLPRLFAWIYRHEVKHKAVLLRCHAVLVSKAEKARAMALLLYQTSAAALAEFRRLKKRADARHQQLLQVGPAAAAAIAADSAALPLVPLRKRLLLHGPGCCYKPPVERSRSAPKLGSITEDALGEELEECQAGPAGGGGGGGGGGLLGGCCTNGTGGPGPGADGDDEEEEEEEEELLGVEEEEEEEAGGPAGAPSLGQLISGLGELAIGNDVAVLRADLRVTRLLSGESTGSESSIESNGGHEGRRRRRRRRFGRRLPSAAAPGA